MTISQQSQAVQIANTTNSLATQLLQLYQAIKINKQAFSDTGAANTLNSLPTRALNADGTLGAADQTTVTSHPIDTVIITNLSRNCSSQQIAAIISLLDNIVNFVDSAADVPIQGGIRGILNNASGG